MNQLEQFREQCAVTAWNHYMDTCKRLNRAPASYEEFIASSAIRALPLPAVSVLDFGADPTGKTDSSAAFQNAIDHVSLVSQTEALRKENEKLNALLLATNNDLMNALNNVHELNEAISNFNALIEFVQTTDEPMKVLDLWQHGCFEELREFWPEAPEAIYPKERAK